MHTARNVVAGSAEQIDFFAVFCPETDGVYLVPIEDVPTRSFARLRVEPSRNGQERFVRHAAPYEVGRVSFVTTAGPGVRRRTPW